ncbi:DUF87 domain-containing protein [Blautia sp. JLR.GB0024]|uniref:ATP-binding protein n=1 Tax=Blautia sp. JLR.GB0024 TaxID=3123295 RepID=UPI003004893A
MTGKLDASYLNEILCRSSLNELETTGIAKLSPERYQRFDDLKWFRIDGMTRFWESNANLEYNTVFADILSSLVVKNTVFAFLLSGTKQSIHFYIGTQKESVSSLAETYRSYVPGIDLCTEIDFAGLDIPVEHVGVMTGYPVDKAEQGSGNEKKSILQIDNICRGMQGETFAYLVEAQRLPAYCGSIANEKLRRDLQQCSMELNVTQAIQSEGGSYTRQATNYEMQFYADNLQKLSTLLQGGIAGGLWSMQGFFMAKEYWTAKKLQGIIKAAFCGENDENFEEFRCIMINFPVPGLKNTIGMLGDYDPKGSMHPLGNVSPGNLKIYQYMFQTIMNSRQLSVFCRLPKTEFSGFYIDDYVEFDTSVRKEIKSGVRIGKITVPGRNIENLLDNDYKVELDDFTRHALIIGITGGGKTNTSKAVLSELWLKHKKPFLVIESAKREYWELMNLSGNKIEDCHGNVEERDFSKLKVFTLGSEEKGRSVKYRINPFERVGTVALQTHIDYLLSTFKASFELYAPMPYILETSVYDVYKDKGWDIVENKNIYGLDWYPTLTDLYYKIDTVTNKLGYHAEVQSNVKAALKARIQSLRIGGKGAMMDTPRSMPIQDLLSTPSVLELEDLGDDDTKSFVIGILLVQLYEYRKSQIKTGKKNLQHILMIEEAHRLLKNVPASEEGTRAKSVEFFCNMLAEIRSFGQGILIADQVPTKLAPDTIKNTNLKIMHRTVMKEDREVMGFAMNMTPEQIAYISSLQRGCAAVYAEGDSKPKLVRMPLIKDRFSMTREEVLQHVRENLYSDQGEYEKKYSYHKGCMMCGNPCQYYQKVKSLLSQVPLKQYVKMVKEKGITIAELEKYIHSLNKRGERTLYVFEKICAVGFFLQEMNLSEEIEAEYLTRYSVWSFERDLKSERE